MTTLRDVNQLRASLKMKFSNYYWYNGSRIAPSNDGYTIIIGVTSINNYVRKTVPPVINGIDIKVEIE